MADVGENSTMVAIYPPKGWRDLLGPHTHLAQWDNLHVTLVYLGQKTREEAKRALEIIEPVVQNHEPFQMKCNGAAAFDNPDAVVRVLQPNGVGLNELRASIYKALNEADLLDEQKHGFVPHMTLEYHEDRKLPENWERVAKLPFGRWTVKDVRVVQGNKEIGRARLGPTEKEAHMSPFERGYYSFMKLAEEGLDANDALIGVGVAGGAGGLGADEVGARLPDVAQGGKARLEEFMDIAAPGEGASRADLEKFIDDYATRGHNMVRENVVNPVGRPPVSGRKFIEEIRSGFLPNTIGGPVKWGPGSAEHYDAFYKSPQEAVSQLIRETELPHANPATSLKELPDDILQATVDHTKVKHRRYGQTIPHVASFLEAKPKIRQLGRAGAILGAGTLGAGLLGKVLDD